MASFTAPLFAPDAFLTQCLNGTATMGDRANRPHEQHPPASVRRFQTALAQLGLPVQIDGIWGPETYRATLLVKTILDIRTDNGVLDGYVGQKTMTAMEEIFGLAMYDAAAISSPFGLGMRTGDQADQGQGVTTVAYDSGLVVRVQEAVHVAVPSPLSDRWLADGGPSSFEGKPIMDAVRLLDVGKAQSFEGGSLVVTLAGATASIPAAVVAELDRAQVGLPTGDPAADPTGEITLLPAEQGTVLWAGNEGPLAVPQAVAVQWSSDTAAGNSPGAPTALAFAVPGSTVFPFAAGHIALSETGAVTRTAVPAPGLERYRLPPDPGRQFEAAVGGNDVTLLVGGNDYFAALAADLARVAPSGFVYLASWNCDIDLACLPGSRSLRDELTRLTGTGVEARMQLWGARPGTTAVGWVSPALRVMVGLAEFWRLKPNVNNPVAVNAVNGLPNSFAFLDENHAPFGSHHQKLVLVGTGSDLVAYVGGIEFTDDRVAAVSKAGDPLAGAPLFDVSVRISGPASKLILTTFAERWAAHPQGATNPLNNASFKPPAVSTGSQRVQVGHTYAQGRPFQRAIRTASELAANAILNATTYFYIEDQYFVGDPRLEHAILTALGRLPPVTGIAVIAAEDSVEDLPDIGFRRREFISKLVAGASHGRFLVFEAVGDDGTSKGPHAYVHSKLILVDDEIALIGSMNSSRRSWNHDSELVASIVDLNGPAGTASGPGFGKATRMELWRRHLKPTFLPALPVAIEPLSAALAAWDTVTLTSGLSVRPYPPAGSGPTRPNFPRLPTFPVPIPIPSPILDIAWNTFVDPA